MKIKKHKYIKPITSSLFLQAGEMMIPSLIGASGQEMTPLNPQSFIP